jgi:hypothetical protein
MLLLADVPPPTGFSPEGDGVSLLIPVAIGVVLLLIGIRLLRRNQEPPPSHHG